MKDEWDDGLTFKRFIGVGSVIFGTYGAVLLFTKIWELALIWLQGKS